MKSILNAALSLLLVSVIHGCGGGGGGGGGAPPANTIPVANAGVAQAVTVGTIATLNGGSSSDANGDVITYVWTITSKPVGSMATIASSTSATPTFVPDIQGVYLISLTVNDGIADSIASSVTVTATMPAPVSFSGTAKAATGLVTDTDVNDPNAPYAANDDAISAQMAPNPGSITGYVSLVGNGQSGSRFATSFDEYDVYRVSLAEGQLVTLNVSAWMDTAPSAQDIDIYLYDMSEIMVTSSEGVGSDEAIVVPASAEYYLVVSAYAGASNYEVTIGSGELASSMAASRLSRFDEFVPGEAVVSFRSPAKAKMIASSIRLDAKIETKRLDLPVLVRASGISAMTASEKHVQSKDRWSGKAISARQAANFETVAMIKEFRANIEASTASPNYIYKTFAVPNDPYYVFQWHYPIIQLPQAWDITTGSRPGNPVIVAVIDTGVVLDHPDLQGQLVSGYDFVSSVLSARDGNGIDANPNDPGDSSSIGMSTWHGTHVAGTVAAKTNNGVGVAGIAANARIMPIRVLGAGGGTTYDILQGIRFSSGLANDSGTVPPQKADVINLSLGGASYDQSTQDAINAARAAGVIVVAAAGNNHVSTPFYPAAYSGVISVSAVNIRGNLAGFSNYGSTIDIAAPGGDNTGADLNADGLSDNILSTLISESSGGNQYDYDFMPGTSMAAPHVAGVIALMRAVNPEISPAQVDDILLSGGMSDDAGISGRDDLFGNGIVNAYRAVLSAQAISGSSSVTPRLLSSVSRIDFGSVATQNVIRLENGGGGLITITNYSSNASWLSVGSGVLNGEGLDYQISIARVGLAVGVHVAKITFESTVGPLVVPVTVQVGASSLVSNAGRLYFLLVNSETGDVAMQDSVDHTNGNYQFSFNDISQGKYYVVAGSDLDNDDFICGEGESCGGWPLSGAAEALTADVSRSGINFPVGVSGALQVNASRSSGFRGFPLLKNDNAKRVR